MSKKITIHELDIEEFTELIVKTVRNELKDFQEKQSIAPELRKKDRLTREEVMEEYSVGSTTLYKLKKAKKLVPENLAGGRRVYYSRKELDKHFK